MIQEKINIKYLPKKKLFTVFTQDVLTSVKQQYKFHSVYCLSIKNHHQIFTNYFQTNELMSILPVRKHFALVTVTLSTGRLCQWWHVPMWGRCGQCGHPRQCETTASVPGTSVRGRSDTDFTLITCNLMLKMYLGVKAAPINFIHSLVC